MGHSRQIIKAGVYVTVRRVSDKGSDYKMKLKMQTASIHQTLQKEKVNLSYLPLNVRLKWVKIKKQRKITQGNSDQNFETFSAYTHLNPPPPNPPKKTPNKLNNNKQTKKREEILTDKGYNIILLTQSAHFICLRAHTKKQLSLVLSFFDQ